MTTTSSIRGKNECFFKKRLARLAILACFAGFLELLVLRSLLFGRSMPPWDFLGGYNTDAYLWWTQGSFFAPGSWVSNVWAGYPSALNLQNSAWFLPVGIASWFAPYTLETAAFLAALYVALGFFGTYLLVRSLKLSFGVSLIVATAGFFGVGYFSNAEHVDIARAYALAPFALLVISENWPWKRWWSIPVAALVLWQSAIGMYPGIFISTAYVGLVWVVAHQLSSRAKFRAYLLPLSISAISAGLLCAPRLLPYFLLSGASSAGLAESSTFSKSMIGTLLYGYSSPALTNDISMRSFFVPATILLLAFFARWRDPATRAGLSVGVPALLLGMPFWPWFQASQSLPGLALSRFTMSDFKPYLILGVLLLASSGTNHLLSLRTPEFLASPRRSIQIPLIGATLFMVVMGIIGMKGPFTAEEWRPAFIILVASFLAIATFVFWRRVGRAALVVLLLAGTVASGTVWAFTTQAPWNSPRLPAESATYGETVAQLLAEGKQTVPEAQRPARLALDSGYSPSDIYSVRWNRVFYTGQAAVGGYLNLKGSQTQAQILAALTEPKTAVGMAAFLAAPGLVYTGNDARVPSSVALSKCAAQAKCGPAVVTPVGYSSGRLSYRIQLIHPRVAVLNEAYYVGWSARVCVPSKACEPVSASRNSLGLVQIALPEGAFVLRLSYETPGLTAGWSLFALGCLLSLLRSGTILWNQVSARSKRYLKSK